MPSHFLAKSLKQILEAKKNEKAKLCKTLKLNSKKALIGVFLDQDLSVSETELLKEVLKAAQSLDLQVVVLSDASQNEFSSELSKGIQTLNYSPQNRSALMQAADIAFCLDFNDVQEMLINGTIPVSLTRQELQNYNPNQESGFGFLFEKADKWCTVAALVRALETYRFPYDWKHIVHSGLASLQD